MHSSYRQCKIFHVYNLNLHWNADVSVYMPDVFSFEFIIYQEIKSGAILLPLSTSNKIAADRSF